jgi:D-alanine-D-alanine ligase
MTKKRIAIVAGGYSSEFEVSLKSAEGVRTYIDKERYTIYIVILKRESWQVSLPSGGIVPIDKNDFSFIEDGVRQTFDFAYITIHGAPGENGLLQGYFELIGLPYSCAGVLTASLTFDKYVCNRYLHSFGINIARSVRLRRGDNYSRDIIDGLGLPVFVKPNAGGSSFGITKVHKAEDLPAAVEKAFSEDDQIVIESFIDGTEVTCGCYCTAEKSVVFPVTEVVSKNEFFDFDAKYNGDSDEITPARIPDSTAQYIQELSLKIYDILDAKGLIRADYIISKDGIPFLLEVNTTPGMTTASFIPQQVRAAGLSMADVLTDIIENELNKAAQ